MGSFGERLRREREMRGISLDDIAAATKIGTRLLRALEEEHFELLPGGIFNKGFVRAYAKFLGLNEEEAVADYLQAAGESVPDPRLIAEQNSSRIDRASGDSGGSRASGFPIIPVLILLVVIAAGAGGWRIYQERMRDRQAKLDAQAAAAPVSSPASAAPGSSSPSAAVAPASTPDAGAGKTPTPNAEAGRTAAANPASTQEAKKSVDLNAPAKTNTATGVQPTNSTLDTTKPKTPPTPGQAASTATASTANAQSFEVAVRAKDRAWVSIKTDGKITVRGIISPPDVKVVHATGEIVFWTGNAGAVEISFNGQSVPLAGGPNSEGTLVFNSHGVVIPKPTVKVP